MQADAAALRFRPQLWPTLVAAGGLRRAARARHLAGRAPALEGGADRRARGAARSTARALAGAERRLARLGFPPGHRGRRVPPRAGAAVRCRRGRGRVGHHVLTPLVRPDGPAVLVDRGWVPADQAHPAARRQGQLEGTVEITGIARYRGEGRPGWFTPDNQPEQGLWYSYDLPALEAALGMELLPVVVEADATPNPGGLPHGRPDQPRPAQQPPAVRDHLVWPRRRPARDLRRVQPGAGRQRR